MKTDLTPDLLFDCLRELYILEKEMAKTLPMVCATATDPGLRELLIKKIARIEDHSLELRAIFAKNRVLIATDAHSALKQVVSGTLMELDKVKEPIIRDILMAAHYKRIADQGIDRCSVAACVARELGFLHEWELIMGFYSEMEITIGQLSSIGVRLLEEQTHNERPMDVAC